MRTAGKIKKGPMEKKASEMEFESVRFQQSEL